MGVHRRDRKPYIGAVQLKRSSGKVIFPGSVFKFVAGQRYLPASSWLLLIFLVGDTVDKSVKKCIIIFKV